MFQSVPTAFLVEPLSEAQLLRFIVQLGILLVSARLLGEVFARLGQPPIIGELLAGIVIGPTLLGGMFPGLYEAVFAPGDRSGQHILEAFSWLGIILLLMVAGMEMDLRLIRRSGKASAYATAFDLLVPASAGVVVGYHLSQYTRLNATDDTVVFVLFFAVMMAISAVPVLARILRDLGLLRTGVGATTLSAAVATDTIGWILLSAAAGLAAGGAGASNVAASVVGTLVFLTTAYLLGRPIVNTLTGRARSMRVEYRMITVTLAVSFGLAAVTQFIGIHAILGAFVGGVLIGQSPHVEAHSKRRMESVVMGFFAPVFFAAAGLKVDLSQLFDPFLLGMALLIIAVASTSKLAGGFVGARLAGMPFWQAGAVGAGLNARGSMEIIAATLALSLGIITVQLYSLIVAMAMVTSMMAPPLIKWTLARGKAIQEPEFCPPGKERSERT